MMQEPSLLPTPATDTLAVKASNEALRESSEALRESNEALRELNEALRESNEALRESTPVYLIPQSLRFIGMYSYSALRSFIVATFYENFTFTHRQELMFEARIKLAGENRMLKTTIKEVDVL
jgi:hypothetical protein